MLKVSFHILKSSNQIINFQNQLIQRKEMQLKLELADTLNNITKRNEER